MGAGMDGLDWDYSTVCTYTSIGTQSACVHTLHGWASVYKVLSCEEEATESCRTRDEAGKRREKARDGITSLVD
jgi:hypothetical protein